MIYVTIAVRDAEQRLTRLLGAVLELSATSREPYRVIVVDDASTDDTRLAARRFARELDVSLVRHLEPHGPAAGLATGVELALAESRRDSDVVVLLTAGEARDPAGIPALVRAVRRGGLALAEAGAGRGPGADVDPREVPRFRALLARRLAFFSSPPRPEVDPGFLACGVGALRSARARSGRDPEGGLTPGALTELLDHLRAMNAATGAAGGNPDPDRATDHPPVLAGS
ncbi:MAG TPA: glycosyltransferase family A protein [Gemmatimonadota bacterium]|jgi:glycosyltransferase involved in cell wall biosynthesis